MKVIFSHGKESGPWGSKIKQLASTAQSLGFSVDSIDYNGIMNPDERVEKLNDYLAHETQDFILVGSSMGGYVSLVCGGSRSPLGIFLLAPALYMDGYLTQDYACALDCVEIVHGWHDDIIPFEHSVKYGKKARCSVHLIDGDHRLNSSLEEVNKLFMSFLEKVKKRNSNSSTNSINS